MSRIAIVALCLAGLALVFTSLAAATDLPRWVQVLSGALSAGLGLVVLGLRQSTAEPMKRRAKGAAVVLCLLLTSCAGSWPSSCKVADGIRQCSGRSLVWRIEAGNHVTPVLDGQPLPFVVTADSVEVPKCR